MRKLILTTLVALVASIFPAVGPAMAVDEGYRLVPVVSGLTQPIAVESPPGDRRLYVVEKPGRIRIVNNGQVTRTFLDIRSSVSDAGERGLLGLVFHPNYQTNRRFYIHYTDNQGDINIVEYRANANGTSARTGTRRLLLEIPHRAATNHNGGDLAIGPDGLLYIAVGDGGGGQAANGQNINNLLGGIVRINPITGNAPPSNPFVGEPGANKLWAYGLRNPWRFTIDNPTGRVIIADVGQNSFEEIDLTNVNQSGVNFGWAVLEGNACFSPPSGCNRAGKRAPIHVYDHGQGRTVIGGHVYRGTDLIGYRGHYFYGDLQTQFVRSFRIVNGDTVQHTNWTNRIGPVSGLVAFGVTSNGELLLVSINGTIWRLDGASCNGLAVNRRGTPAAENIVGTPGRDVIYAGPGSDTVRGRGGNDVICGAQGTDTLRGEGGNDVLIGGTRGDELRGGSGADILRGKAGNDDLFGRPGPDRLFGEAGRDTLRGGWGNDILRGGTWVDTLHGGQGRDRCFSGTTVACEV